MTALGRVLVLEDRDEWRELLRNLLVDAGYFVDTASNSAEAVEHLKKSFYHLAVFDINLDRNDPDEQGGMDLLEELYTSGSIKTMKVIMLTGYGNKAQMRAAFSKFEVEDFQEKDFFDPVDFIENVKKMFSDKIKNNPSLLINWQYGSLEQAVLNLRLFDNDTRVKKSNSNLYNLIALELDDLLRRLFYDAESLLVKPMTPGLSGTNVLWAKAFYPNVGGTAPMIIKFGDSKAIEREKNNFDTYVLPFIANGRHPSVVKVKYTQRLGGIVYKLLGADENLKSFAEYYSKVGVEEVTKVLDNLFYGTCHSWYKNPGFEHVINFTQYYLNKLNISKDRIEGHLKNLGVTQPDNRAIAFNMLDKDNYFVNPVATFVEKDITLPIYESIVHGDLNAGNILVDKDKNAWLIDFGATEKGHILQDFVELDSIIRFQLLEADHATLEERLHLERCLSQIEDFNEIEQLKNSFRTENASLVKAFTTILHLQNLAAKFLPDKKADMDEYYLTLIFYALTTIRFSSLETVQRQHALICASLLTEKLSKRGVYG